MTEPSLTTLIGDEIQGDRKWSDFVDGEDGFFYGIPSCARRVVKFNPLDKSLTEIGPDFGDDLAKWTCGVRANTGDIYCAPCNAEHILKIKTSDGTVETLENVELPETARNSSWVSGALAQDTNIYYMPYNARRIMKLNPDNDTLSSVGDDLGIGYGKYIGTVVGKDDCLCGIPYDNTHIIKFDPTNSDTTHTVGEEARFGFECGNGVLAGDGYIYSVNRFGQVLKVDSTTNNYTWIGDQILSGFELGWGDPIVGADKCIYWPPRKAHRVLKFDPETQHLPSLVGDDFGRQGDKWNSGALATDGAIYCVPSSSSQVLAIDPFKELSMTLQTNMNMYPQELGHLFVKDDEERDETFFESSLRKFGGKKVFTLIEECLPLDAEWAGAQHNGNLPPFMVAASCENCAVSVIYYLLRRNLHALLTNYNDDGNNIQNKKRKLGGN
jgi:hypothetical protein